MELFTKLFGNLLAFVYHCFDRIVIHGYLSLTLANSEQAYRHRGMRNMGSLSTISCALSSMSFMRPRFPKVVHRPLAFDQ